MKRLYTFLAVAAVIVMSSCSSSRTAQTTDDIYYSSGNRKVAAAGGEDGSEYYSTRPSDNYVRLKTQDPARWSYFDDYSAYDSYYSPVGASVGYGYGYPAYGFGYGMGYGYGMGMGYGMGFMDPYMAWNSYFLWNSWYNPYFYNPYYGGGVFVVGGHSTPTAIYSNLRPFNSVAYRNGISHTTRTTTGTGGRYYRPGMSTTSNYNNSVNGQGRPVNNTSYRPFQPSSNNNGGFRPASTNNGSFSQPSRSYSPSGGGGGGGGFSRPGRH